MAEVLEVEEASEIDNSELAEEEEVEPVVTRQEAQTAFNLVRRFVENNTADSTILSCSDKLEDYFYKERQNNEKQSKLTDFFQMY